MAAALFSAVFLGGTYQSISSRLKPTLGPQVRTGKSHGSLRECLHWIAKWVQPRVYLAMQTLEQIEEEVRQLPAAEQKALLANSWVSSSSAMVRKAMARQAPLTRFFAEWDANRSVTEQEQVSVLTIDTKSLVRLCMYK